MRVAVSGARGRVGQEIVSALTADPAWVCAAAVTRGDDLEDALQSSRAQALVDFTSPEIGLHNGLTAARLGVAPVVGTTGLGVHAEDRLRQACAEAGVGGCIAANFAVGATLMMWLAELAAVHFESCEIVETHHAAKLDAPSGTALRTAERLLRARGDRHFRHRLPATTALEGTRGGTLGGIAVHSLRMEGAVADQTVLFGAAGQTLSIEHRTTSRAAFVPGVLMAVRAVLRTQRFYSGLDEVMELPDARHLASSGSP